MTVSPMNEHHDKAFFFYLTHRIVSALEVATGLQIKEMIKAVVPDFDLQHTLVLEGRGREEDRVIGDQQDVSLRVDREEPPKHFYSKPPTNFGVS